MKTEILIQEVIATARPATQKGDVSRHLLEQGFFDKGSIPRGLKRDEFWSGGNPIDTLEDFERQQIKGD